MRRLEGRVEYSGPRFIRGWALDRSRPRHSVRIDVMTEGRSLARLTPSLLRPDLELAVPTARCGFVFPISPDLLDNRRRWLHFSFAEGGQELEGSPVPIRRLDEAHSTPFVVSDPTGQRVLVLAPHPDDESLGCGGTLVLHRRSGDAVKLVVLTDGSLGDWSGGTGGARYVEQRQAEALAASARLGVTEVEFWGLPDRGLGLAAEAEPRLVELLSSLRPTLIYCTSPLDAHPDHRAAAGLLHAAMARSGSSATVAFYELSRPLNVNRLVDISSVVETKAKAVAEYESQLERRPYLDAALGLNRFRSLTVGGSGSGPPAGAFGSGPPAGAFGSGPPAGAFGSGPPAGAFGSGAPAGGSPSHVEGFLTLDGESFRSQPLHAVTLSQLGAVRPRRLDTEPLVSIIVRTRNRPQLLHDALSSLLCQSYPSLEVVVVNDGDEDLYEQVAELGELLTLVVLPVGGGPGRAAAANRGIEAANGKLIGFLDDDDLLYPDHLAKLAGFLETTGEDIAYSGCDWARYATRGGRFELVERTAPPFDMDYDPQRLRIRNFLPIHCVLFSRTVVEEIGPLDESFEIYEDWDFWIRASERFHFHYLPGATAEYRMLADHAYDHLLWHLRIYEKHGFPRGPLRKTWMGLVWSGREVAALRAENGRLRSEVERLSQALSLRGPCGAAAPPSRGPHRRWPRVRWLVRAWWRVLVQRARGRWRRP